MIAARRVMMELSRQRRALELIRPAPAPAGVRRFEVGYDP